MKITKNNGNMRLFSVVKPIFRCYTVLATQFDMEMFQACVISYLVKTQALFRLLGRVRKDVAAVGAVRFSVRGFDCVVFLMEVTALLIVFSFG